MSDYDTELAEFVAAEKASAERKPSGFFGEWAFYLLTKRKFDLQRENETQAVNGDK